jgi:integrase
VSSDNYTKLPEPEHSKVLARINVATGVLVYRLKDGFSGKPYMVSVRDEAAKKSPKFTCHTLDEVVAVAREKHSGFTTGTDSAGQVKTKHVLDLLVDRMRSLDRREQTIHDLRIVIEAGIAKGLTNLKDPLIAAKVKTFLEGYHPNCGFGPRKNRSARTIAKLIGFWRQLGKEATLTLPRPLLMVNPFLAIRAPKQTQNEMETLTFEDCGKLVSDSALQLREGLYWAFRLYTCMRTSAAVWVRWSHIDFAAKRIRVTPPDAMDAAEAVRLELGARRHKRIKRRTAFRARLTDELAAELLKVKPTHDRDSYVFPEAMRTRGPGNEGRAFRTHLKHCGITHQDIHPHEIRSTGACLWAALVEEDRLVRHLGHSRNAMTRHYTERADQYEEATKTWTDGQWHLRSPAPRVHAGETGGGPIGSATASGQLSAEDDIGNDWVVVLNDFTGLVTD